LTEQLLTGHDSNLYSKVQSYEDAPVEGRFAPYGDAGKYYMNGPRIHEFYQEMRKDVVNKVSYMIHMLRKSFVDLE